VVVSVEDSVRVRETVLPSKEGIMPEEKENREASLKESDLEKTQSRRKRQEKERERSEYWREQDPKYTG
jgi:hypothetical protein